MEAATEFVQGGDCGYQFTTLLRDVMRAAGAGGMEVAAGAGGMEVAAGAGGMEVAAGAGGMEVEERVQELSRLQKMVRDCVLSLMICMLIDDVADPVVVRFELGDDVVVFIIILLLLLLLIAVQATT
jgi:hypothetical protein